MISWHDLTRSVAHRPWPLPKQPWVMTMSWVDLLFAHWSFDPAVVRPLIPRGLELETYDGRAWLGVVPFRMESVGPRGLGWLPGRLPSPRSFPELNLRTYVRHGDMPGVCFFSLDATSRLAVEAARRFFHLPYVKAQIQCRRRDGWVDYHCHRQDRRLAGGEFKGRYRPAGVIEADPLELWLTERYCLYSQDRRGRLWRGHIHHLPWPLQRAEVEIEVNSIADAHGFRLDEIDSPSGEPLLHFVERLDVVAWGLEAVT